MRVSSKSAVYVLCVLSAGALILAFPKTDLWICAWGGLVPLMFMLDEKKPLDAFRSAYLCGVLFFTGTFFWFFHLTQWFSTIAVVGVVLLLLYLALYFGLFGLVYSLFSHHKPLFKLFLLPSVWVVLEFIRGYFFTGFDWASLGHSQYKNLPVIQIADVTGVYGVSFIIVMVNILLKELITVIFITKTPQAQRAMSVLIGTTAVAVVCVLGYGTAQLSSANDQDLTEPSFSIAVVQANIPQEIKWEKSAFPGIMTKYQTLTEEAALHQPDLIIWPETSHPGYLWDDKEYFTQMQELVRRIKIPLLFGSVLHEKKDYYNSAVLLTEYGDVNDIYRKVHLVPFGEYLPLRSTFPFLSRLVDIGDFTAGDQWTVFSLELNDKKEKRFSVLICFEDTVARLSRQFVRNGAQLLVNITNDAWFGDSKAPFMHLQTSVFRTIENRRDLVRAANTGVSSFIDRWGRIVNFVANQNGSKLHKTSVSGFVIEKVNFNDKITFYTKFGDVFTILCFGCILVGIIKSNRLKA